MPRRAALFTQADIARLIRGAKQEGAGAVTIEMPSGVKFSISLDKTFKRSDIMDALHQESDEEAAFTL